MNIDMLIKSLLQKTDSKIVLLVMDGLGGIRTHDKPKTELELAQIPNMNKLAQGSACGRILPVAHGITPGSGPAHFALFGYDPADEEIQIGRGVLEALGLDMELRAGDVATRCNFATMDVAGLLTDRRAGRIPTEECVRLCAQLSKIKKIRDVEVIIKPGEQYRFVVVFRGEGIYGAIHDTDPQVTGTKALTAVAQDSRSEKMAEVANEFIHEANRLLAGESKANTLLMRGFSVLPKVPSMSEKYGLNAACIASFPLYRGVASVVGMDILPTGADIADEFRTLQSFGRNMISFFFT